MTEEELKRYARLGVRAAVKTQADEVQLAITRFNQAQAHAGDIYTVQRFMPVIDGLQNALDSFKEAILLKEKMESGSARRTEPVRVGYELVMHRIQERDRAQEDNPLNVETYVDEHGNEYHGPRDEGADQHGVE